MKIGKWILEPSLVTLQMIFERFFQPRKLMKSNKTNETVDPRESCPQIQKLAREHVHSGDYGNTESNQSILGMKTWLLVPSFIFPKFRSPENLQNHQKKTGGLQCKVTDHEGLVKLCWWTSSIRIESHRMASFNDGCSPDLTEHSWKRAR